MAFNTQRRPSSWFGPQFKFESFSLPGLPSLSPRASLAVPSANYGANYFNNEPLRSSNLRPAMEQLPMPEPLFQDSYISDDDFSPLTPDPRLKNCLWDQQVTTQDYFAPVIASETLEDFGLASAGGEECDVLATYVSIVKLGKPKVVDILAPTLSRLPSPTQSPRLKSKPAAARPPIVWRMPSYDSTTRTDDMSYSMSDRSESFDSRSTYPSSLSEGPNTPGSFSESIKINDSPMIDPVGFLEPPSLGSMRRPSTLLRRHSRNLSASFSKAFLTRLKDAESPPPSFKQAPQLVEPMINYSLPYSATRRPDTPDSFVTNADLHINPQLLAPLSRKAPVLRRKKSIAGAWF